MASKIIFMDGIATAHLRDDESVRIEIGPGMTSGALESSLARIPAAIRRALPAQARPLAAPLPNGDGIEHSPGPSTERAL